ncbi:hypothetical protein B0I37DRAFT_408918 [Chaetomium sp. MPI-CAGE-AT-0009]|nr:hypothetical protein B0I37DRAFT_408918 [Chaetomium sp. MPI-CAGE-AT-0009]
MDSRGFYQVITDSRGIDQEWIKFGKRHMRTNNGCQYGGDDVLACQDNWFRNYPLTNDAKIDIYNSPRRSSATPSMSPTMEKIMDTADDIIKAEREDFIPGFLTCLLFWIPFVGEAIGALGAGMAVHDVAETSDNAFVSLFSDLLSAGIGCTGFRNAALSKRDLAKKEFRSFGNVK